MIVNHLSKEKQICYRFVLPLFLSRILGRTEFRLEKWTYLAVQCHLESADEGLTGSTG